MRAPQVAFLPDGCRLHLHDGPIDLVIEAFGADAAVDAAYRAAVRRFTGLLDELVAELELLRTPADPFFHFALQRKRDGIAGGEYSPPPCGEGSGVGRFDGRGPEQVSPAPTLPDKGEGSPPNPLPRPDPTAPDRGPGLHSRSESSQWEERTEGLARGGVARRMCAAVAPFAAECFITPMAAVAGAVAEEILAAMTGAAPLARAYVNNGGDIAFHLTPGEAFTLGLVDRPDRPSLSARATIGGRDLSRGIATSGWRGRSFSLGIADAVSVLAATAAQADAAATIIANAVDLPGHPAIARAPAISIKPDNDLGERLVTRGVGRLSPREIVRAIAGGLARAEALCDRSLIHAAAIHLQGETRVLVPGAGSSSTTGAASSALPLERDFAHV